MNKTSQKGTSGGWRWACWDSAYTRLGYGGPFQKKEDAWCTALAFKKLHKQTNYCAVGIENRSTTLEGILLLKRKWVSWQSPEAKQAITGLTIFQHLLATISNVLRYEFSPKNKYQLHNNNMAARKHVATIGNTVVIHLNGGGAGGIDCGSGSSGEGGGGGGSGGGKYYVDCWVKGTYEHTNTFGPFSNSGADQCIKNYKSKPEHANEECGKRH